MSPEALLLLEQTSYDVLGASVSDAIVRSRLRATPIAAISQRRAPRWLQLAKIELNDLQCLAQNWDSYGAIPVSGYSAAAAFDVLRQTVTDSTPMPSIVPNSDGTVQLEWHVNGFDLEVRLVSQARISVSFEDNGNPDNDFEGELQFDLTPLRRAVTRISK